MDNEFIKEKQELLESINIMIQTAVENLKFSCHIEEVSKEWVTK